MSIPIILCVYVELDALLGATLRADDALRGTLTSTLLATRLWRTAIMNELFLSLEP